MRQRLSQTRSRSLNPEALRACLRTTSEATYAPKLEREHGQIDWSQPAQAIERKIRAFNPWPGAYTILRDDAGRERKLKIFSAFVDQTPAPPGALAVSGQSMIIGAADGALRLEVVQLEGKKRMNAADFLRGHTWLAHGAATLPSPGS